MTAKNFYTCWSRFGMSNSSLHPIGDENIRFVRSFSVAIGGPDEALAVLGKHREGVEIRMVGDAVEARSVFVDHIEIETARVLLILQV